MSITENDVVGCTLAVYKSVHNYCKGVPENAMCSNIHKESKPRLKYNNSDHGSLANSQKSQSTINYWHYLISII